MSAAVAPVTTGNILELDDIHVYYGAIHALKGVSLSVREKEIVTLIGANGAGKSTTLRAINGLNRPRQGAIRFEGDDITTATPHTIVKRGIAQSPEGRRLFPRIRTDRGRVRTLVFSVWLYLAAAFHLLGLVGHLFRRFSFLHSQYCLQ